MTTNKTLRQYHADELLITLGPVIINGGFADGEFLRVEQDTEDTTDVVGSDGEVAVSRTNDRRATATIMLLQTAAANDGLSILSNLAKEAKAMAGAIVPFAVKDLNGRTLLFGANAWVSKAPDRTFDRGATANEWSIRIAHLVRYDGGN